MCQTQAEGGKRCATHTRPRYEALIAAMDARAAKSVFNKGQGRQEARRTFEVDDENALNVAINHASTPSGFKQVTDDVDRFRTEGDQQTVAFLTSALKRGTERAEAAKEANVAIRKAKEQAKRKATRSSGQLTRSAKATDTWNLQAVFPGVAELWDTEKNHGIEPTEVTPNVNKDIWLRCKEGHSWSGRGNNVVAPVRNGKRFYPLCPECEGRKPRQFAATQEELTSLVSALGDDPEAFEALTPALQYQVMSHLGLLRGGQDSMSRSIGMSIVHGDLTLKDVVTAQDFAAVDGRVRDNLDDEQAVGTLTDLDLPANTAPARTSDVDRVLASVGVLDVIDNDTDLAANIAREANESLWEQAYLHADDLDGYLTDLTTRRGTSPQAAAAIDRFTRELDLVRTTPLPEGYQATRVSDDGQRLTLDPTLAQRRFAALVTDRRRVMNWSGTGAGKTLSSTLAVQASGAQETLVVCPKQVIDQWAAEFANGFPDHTEIRYGLPDPHAPLPPPAAGTNRVWIANYDKFQTNPEALQRQLSPLADRVDAVVFDEIHMAKVSDEASTSLRRRALEKFTDQAGRANPDLVVIGASATPVVNNLEEARSVLRLVEGPDSRPFPTKPTIKNAAAAHHRLASAGIRHRPTYDTTLTRRDVTIDVTDRVHHIQANLNRQRVAKDNQQARVTPAMMERALLPEKIPALIETVRANNGPTVVYTHYVDGMVAPMKAALTDQGLRVATYTGNETAAERAEALRRFRTGDVDVLIGSKPIATGVDGLQHTSHNMVVVSMPWTAADDDQLVGRLDRRGQQRDVTITYLLTEATAGKTRWSWCKDNRQRRVHYKRDIANAAVDGVLPDGTLDTSQSSAERALGGLKELAATLAKRVTSAA